MAETLADASQVTAQAFTSLHNSVNSFSLMFQPFALAHKVADQAPIEQLMGEISDLQVKITGYPKFYCFLPHLLTNI
jgi:hypothetical protein